MPRTRVYTREFARVRDGVYQNNSGEFAWVRGELRRTIVRRPQRQHYRKTILAGVRGEPARIRAGPRWTPPKQFPVDISDSVKLNSRGFAYPRRTTTSIPGEHYS
ncbi:MAG: hypothetical protein GY820_00780 [Gammaproteobacteria bacterium]|nr:hypothetical protein [Gammaproteobacteria bacterium]